MIPEPASHFHAAAVTLLSLNPDSFFAIANMLHRGDPPAVVQDVMAQALRENGAQDPTLEAVVRDAVRFIAETTTRVDREMAREDFKILQEG